MRAKVSAEKALSQSNQQVAEIDNSNEEGESESESESDSESEPKAGGGGRGGGGGGGAGAQGSAPQTKGVVVSSAEARAAPRLVVPGIANPSRPRPTRLQQPQTPAASIGVVMGAPASAPASGSQ
jgi:hypothetical protein